MGNKEKCHGTIYFASRQAIFEGKIVQID